MKHFTILLIFALSLSGCRREVPGSEVAANNAIATITAIQESLPKECQTSSNQLLFKVAQSEIREVKTHCDSEKVVITREKIKWEMATIGLLALIIIYILRKVMK